MKKSFDYTSDDISKALKLVGMKKGDSIFLHSNLGFFGKLKDANDTNEYCKIFKKLIFEVIGQEGTLIVPTFSLSFCNNQIYDKKQTPSVECGIFSEYIRQDEDSIRSDDANFSVCAIGVNAEFFTSDSQAHSFGADSFWERLLKENGKICRFNLGSDYNTFVHYVEWKFNVPYRYDKEFSGISMINDKKIEKKFIHFVRDLEKEEHMPDLSRLDQKAKERELLHVTDLGKGQIISINSLDIYQIISDEIKKDPSFLIKGSI